MVDGVSGDGEGGFDRISEALAIFKRYANPTYPFHCSHDTLWVLVEPGKVSDEDKKRLDELGFFPCDEDDGDQFISFRYGSG